MEHLKDTENFGTVFKEGEDLETFFSKFISFVERRIFNRISKRVNWVLDRQKDDSFEITKSGNAIDSNGNFRIINSGDDWLIQIKSGGTWITVEKYHGS